PADGLVRLADDRLIPHTPTVRAERPASQRQPSPGAERITGTPLFWATASPHPSPPTLAASVMAKPIARQAQSSTAPLALPPTQRFLPFLLLLFIGSGCAALIYEIVWFQLIELVIGSSAVSLGVLLGTFMGGMCLGSLLLPRYVTPSQHPLCIYAMLEAGIGVLGLIVLVIVPLLGGVYTATAMHGLA